MAKRDQHFPPVRSADLRVRGQAEDSRGARARLARTLPDPPWLFLSLWLARGTVALEDVSVDLDVLPHWLRNVFFGKDSGHRALGLTGAAIDTFVRMNEQL